MFSSSRLFFCLEPEMKHQIVLTIRNSSLLSKWPVDCLGQPTNPNRVRNTIVTFFLFSWVLLYMGNVFLSSRNHRFRFSSVRADSQSLHHSYRYELEKQIDENQPEGIHGNFWVPVGFWTPGDTPENLGLGCAALGLTPWPYLRMRQTKTDPLGKNL